jgi:hypothetical protein
MGETGDAHDLELPAADLALYDRPEDHRRA